MKKSWHGINVGDYLYNRRYDMVGQVIKVLHTNGNSFFYTVDTDDWNYWYPSDVKPASAASHLVYRITQS